MPEPTYPALVTPTEIITGVKTLNVELLTGEGLTITLHTAPRRLSRSAVIHLQDGDFSHLVGLCDPRDLNNTALGERLLDRLTPESAGIVEDACVGLLFGVSFQKKILEAGKQALQQMASMSPAPSSPASPPASPSPSSTTGASPN